MNPRRTPTTSKAVAAHRSSIGNIEVTVNVAVDGAKGKGGEVASYIREDPDGLKAIEHDVTVPGRLVTGDEASEDIEPELTPDGRKDVSKGKNTVSPGLHGRGDGERTCNREDLRKEVGVNSARESATR